MSRRWVSDASPLILLAKIDRLDLLPTLTDELVIPEAVALEVSAGPPDDPARHWLEEDSGKRFVQAVDEMGADVAAWDLGGGESAVLTWAFKHEGWTALIDDGAARRAAQAMGMALLGTVGIVLLAKHESVIPRAQPVLDELVQAGLHVSNAVLERALQQVGESESL